MQITRKNNSQYNLKKKFIYFVCFAQQENSNKINLFHRNESDKINIFSFIIRLQYQ